MASDSAFFARLADISLPTGGYVVSLAEVYVDESGTHQGSPILCVAGYIFEKKKAVYFDAAWGTHLKKFGISHFHMTDCAHRTGPFAGKTDAQCDVIERKFIELVHRNACYGFAVTVNQEEFDQYGPKHREFGSAYSFCARQALVAVLSWIKKTSFKGKMSYFFESGHKHQRQANAIMDRVFKMPELNAQYHYSAHAFIDKKMARPLQAADLLAWQWFTDSKRKREGKMTRRKDCTALLRPQDQVMTWTIDMLKELDVMVKSGKISFGQRLK